MILLDHEQYSAQWWFVRLGLPTSSEFHRLLTPTLKPSRQAETTYLYDKLAEFFVGESQGAGDDGQGTAWTRRGTAMEAEARRWYEFDRSVKVEECGFCLSDCRRYGASPDGLVGEDGLFEAKCPKASLHIGIMLGEDAHKHRAQIQGQLLVTGREWCDLVVYSPCLPPTVTRHEPDEEWIAAFEPALAAFLERLETAKAELRSRGLVGKDGKR